MDTSRNSEWSFSQNVSDYSHNFDVMNPRRLLLPFSWPYGAITFLRNKCFDWGIFSVHEIEKKSILVGNLSVGGTGKTPHITYLIEYALKKGLRVTTLSRGYGRKTKGVLLANSTSTAEEIGDEPLLFQTRYGDKINVVVAEKRVEGIEFINGSLPQTDLILLDDAFQHRAVKAGFSIVITPYFDLFTKDFVLPAGNLREWKSGKHRADMIVVSKSPDGISTENKNQIVREIDFGKKPVLFSRISYGKILSFNGKEISTIPENVLLVTGIANPTPLIQHLEKQTKITHLKFSDHHNFTASDIQQIHEKFDIFASQNALILTTEKDFMRLKGFKEIKSSKYPWSYQSISVEFDENEQLKKHLDEYLGTI